MEWVAAGGAAAFVACAVGGLVGFASSLVLLPALLGLGLELRTAVVVNLVVAVVTRVPTLVVLRREVDRRRTGWLLAGTAPGAVVGLVVVSRTPSRLVELVVGLVVVLAGCSLARDLHRTDGPATARAGPLRTVTTGVGSGLLGATTSLNGVPPALLLARTERDVTIRLADLSAFFVLGNVLTLGLLLASGGGADLPPVGVLGAWVVAGAAGHGIGTAVGSGLEPGRFDRLTTTIVVLCGALALVSAAVG